MRKVVSVAMVLLGLLSASGVADVPTPEVPYDNAAYDGRFTFVRLRFEPTHWGSGPYAWGLDLKWNHDYPYAERNLYRILTEITNIRTTTDGSEILAADDPRLFDYPLAYICEVGYWNPSDEEAAALRAYLEKGGFLIVDDFADLQRGITFQLTNFRRGLEKVLPGAKLVRLDASHPIFKAFYDVEDLDFTHPSLPYLDTEFFGVFEDDDPTKRLMMIVNYNNDIGDYWEWSDSPQSWYPIDLTQKGFQLGINYILYGMSH